MSLSKKLRFEVFKRDKFSCQYCGKSAPDVLLHADHIEPKSKGGKDSILNLITSCEACNLGKGARPLTDDSVVAKQRAQLESLEERQQQIKMLLEWQHSLTDVEDEAAAGLADMWEQMCPYEISDSGMRFLRSSIRKFGLAEVAESMRIARDTYFVTGGDGKPTVESVTKAFDKISGICMNRRNQAENPHYYDSRYIIGTLRNRFPHYQFYSAQRLIRAAFEMGLSKADLYHVACQATSPSAWTSEMEDLIGGTGS